MKRLALEFLPRRRDPEPGSIELPRILFDWITDGRDDGFDLADAALLVSFHGGDAHAITISDAGHSVRLARGFDAGGCLQVRKSLAALRRNKWVETEHAHGTLTIRPGVRMRKLTVRLRASN